VTRRIFDPFFTTKGIGSGTGLELTTARRIVVDRHNGSLLVQSAPGRTTFLVRLPLR
jgi:signal transduction histidine kinase